MSLADDYFNKGLAAYSARDFSSATDFFCSAISENPNNANYYYYRGVCLCELGKNPEAIEDYSSALNLCPGSVAIRCCRAELYLNCSKNEEAEADFSGIIESGSEEDERYWISLSYLGRGLLKVERGELEEAICDFSKAEELAEIEGDNGLRARIARELERSGI